MKHKRWVAVAAVLAVILVASGVALAMAVAGRGDSSKPAGNAPTTTDGVVIYPPGETPPMPSEPYRAGTITYGEYPPEQIPGG